MVAIKTIKKSSLNEENLVKIDREIDVLKKIGKHDHILKLYQVIKTNRYYMLVTQYCPNGELYEYLLNHGKLNETQSCDYFLQILSAVEYLHERNVVHRDLKLENLLLTENNKTIKIADFGFANYYKDTDLLSTWCGSPPYAAPELFEGLKYCGPPVDIWSMGVILYAMVCNSLPFDGKNLMHLKARVLAGKFRVPFYMSTDCEGLIRVMLRRDPNRRFTPRQIRSHRWVIKYDQNNRVEKVVSKELPETHAKQVSGNQSLDVADVRATEANVTSTRGQSLDLDDKNAKTEAPASSNNEDQSMTCLSARDEKSLSASTTQTGKQQDLKVDMLIEEVMAEAVSNMSIDSSNSCTSNMLTASEPSSSTVESSSSRKIATLADARNNTERVLRKESSIDDQIIDFMVDVLRVARNHIVIRQSIANSLYDDLHAIYQMIKYEPNDFVKEISEEYQRFKAPSVPILPFSTLDARSFARPRSSITAGILGRVQQIQPDVAAFDQFAATQQEACALKSSDNSFAYNKGTKCDNEEQQKASTLHRNSDAWSHATPQLYLTPPTDGHSRKGTGVEAVAGESNARSIVSRHSFDCTPQRRQQTPDLKTCPNVQATTALTYLHQNTPDLWNSSILDSIGVSTPPQTMSNAQLPLVSATSSISNNEALIDLLSCSAYQQLSNAQQQHSSLVNPEALVSQLRSLAVAAGLASSHELDTNQPVARGGNNEERVGNVMTDAINKDTAMTKWFAQNANANQMPNLNLLDPNELVSGVVRRASDGEASYNSLSATQNQSSSKNANFNFPESELRQHASNDTSGYQTTTSPSVNISDLTSLSTSSNLNRFSFFDNNSSQLQLRANNQTQSGSNDANQKDDTQQQTQDPLDLRVHNNAEDTLNATTTTDGRPLVQSSSYNSSSANACVNALAASCYQHPSSASTSPRNSIIPCCSNAAAAAAASTATHLHHPAYRQSICAQRDARNSPSSLSLTGGGTGHLLNRRKRHSLDSESRNYCVHQAHTHYHNHTHNHQISCNTYNQNYPTHSHTHKHTHAHRPANHSPGQRNLHTHHYQGHHKTAQIMSDSVRLNIQQQQQHQSLLSQQQQQQQPGDKAS